MEQVHLELRSWLSAATGSDFKFFNLKLVHLQQGRLSLARFLALVGNLNQNNDWFGHKCSNNTCNSKDALNCTQITRPQCLSTQSGNFLGACSENCVVDLQEVVTSGQKEMELEKERV